MQYATPEAFKQALETRVRAAAMAGGTPMARFRQILVLDRFLARVFAEFGDRVIVKVALFSNSGSPERATKDVDLRLRHEAVSRGPGPMPEPRCPATSDTPARSPPA